MKNEGPTIATAAAAATAAADSIASSAGSNTHAMPPSPPTTTSTSTIAAAVTTTTATIEITPSTGVDASTTNTHSVHTSPGAEAVVVAVPPADQQMFAALRSTMERNAQHWRSNFTNAVLRPLVQQRVQHHHHHHHHGTAVLPSLSSSSTAATAAVVAQSHSAAQQPPQSYLDYSANNLLQQWMPNRYATAAATATTSTTTGTTDTTGTPPPPVVINLDASDVRPPHTSSMPRLYNPNDRHSLIDMGRLHRSHSDATGASTSATAPDSRPTQFDDRRAQILADLQNEPPHPNPASPPNNGGTGSGADIFVQIPEARQLLESLLRYLPYVLIVGVKYMIDHMDGILNVALLVIMFAHANWQVKKQISRQKQRSLFALWRELAYVTVVLMFVCMLIGEWTWYQWWFGAPSDGAGVDAVAAVAVGDAMAVADAAGGRGGGGGDAEWPLRRLLYNVLLTDMVAKLVTVHLKICVTLLPQYVINFRNRGRVYLFMEGVSQLVRSMLPVLPWMVYLLMGYTGYDKVFGMVLSATYIIAKSSDLMRTATMAKDGVMELFKIVRIGSNPTKEELQAAGDQCPICHDTYTDPMRLSCTHIFCEACVATWFDREPTCPLCRALVGDDPSWRDGATSHFIQFY